MTTRYNYALAVLMASFMRVSAMLQIWPTEGQANVYATKIQVM